MSMIGRFMLVSGWKPEPSDAEKLASLTASLSQLVEAVYVLNGTMVPFNEAKQEFFCRVCRYRDPLGPDGNKLHDDNCPLYELLELCESATAQATKEPALKAQDGDVG